jgi:hypothetical protein
MKDIGDGRYVHMGLRTVVSQPFSPVINDPPFKSSHRYLCTVDEYHLITKWGNSLGPEYNRRIWFDNHIVYSSNSVCFWVYSRGLWDLAPA